MGFWRTSMGGVGDFWKVYMCFCETQDMCGSSRSSFVEVHISDQDMLSFVKPRIACTM